jgi:hypothetical protein
LPCAYHAAIEEIWYQKKQFGPLLIVAFLRNARQRFEDLVTHAQADFIRSGASHFRIFNVMAKPCEYCVEMIFSSDSSFREFECGQVQ